MPRRAAQYLRMSTERQEYSLTYQATAISAYAAQNDLEVVETFADEGISGLAVENRAALRQLLSTVTAGAAGFEAILVYDVSRWGRFQNPDEAAHYEFICAEAGVTVEYCAEQFPNDRSPISGLIKHIKRAMAAEYSRELSEKVRSSQKGLQACGYWMGSTPGFALRREAVTQDGRSLGLLADGQYNPFPGAHTRLAHGPAEELEVVRRTFRLYLRPGSTIASVTRTLNKSEGSHQEGGAWTVARVGKMLSDPRYIGIIIVNRSHQKLGGVRIPIPESEWIALEGVLKPIISPQIYHAVQRRRELRRKPPSNEAVVRDLQRVYEHCGRVSHHALRKYGKWSPSVYISRLGPADALYNLCSGAKPASHRETNLLKARETLIATGVWHTKEELLLKLCELWRAKGYLTARLIEGSSGVPCARTYEKRFGCLAEAYRLIGYSGRSSRQAAAIQNSLASSRGLHGWKT